jgi:hypothetical protein
LLMSAPSEVGFNWYARLVQLLYPREELLPGS